MRSAALGFSLVELSIVLVILGLLVGGVLTAQNLIRAAELRAIPTEFQQYQTATLGFLDKYHQLPGDMRNATDFWGSAGGTGKSSDAACRDAISSTSATCSGNSDGTFTMATAADMSEAFQFWKHLANAKFIEGDYTGRAGPANSRDAEIGINVPSSRLSKVGFSITYVSPTSFPHPQRFDAEGGKNQFNVGTDTIYETYGAAFTPPELWNLDKKIDDGLPNLGVVLTWKGTCNNASNTEYAVDRSDKVCVLIMIPGF